MSADQTEFGTESGLGPEGEALRISLDPVHTLLLCPGPYLSSMAEQLQSAGGDGTGLGRQDVVLLLFRAADPGGGMAPESPPQLWVEAEGLRLPLLVAELAGWEQASAAAVALLRWGPAIQLDQPQEGPARVHLRGSGGPVAVELPAAWREHIGRLPGAG